VSLSQVFGQAGNDTITLDEASGALPKANLFGGAGDDTPTGGSGADQLFGEAGNDRMIWNFGDDNALNEGAAGSDTGEVKGGNASETFTVSTNGFRVRFDHINPAPFFVDNGTSENLILNAPALRASVSSTEASNGRLARVGVFGPK
jgi:RTX calcium-binding nonapeptide repeat (4 copies)